jgi:hypothetical protein
MKPDFSRFTHTSRDVFDAYFSEDLNDASTRATFAPTFLREFRARNEYAVEEFMKARPNILDMLGYLSMGCEGGWAMPVWQHIGNMIRETPNDAAIRRMASFVARRCRENVRAETLMQYGIMGNWLDLVEESIALGVPKKFLGPVDNFDPEWSPAIRAALHRYFADENPKADKEECVICMNASAVYQIPCAHICMCKKCGMSVNQCPLCRTPYE